MYHDNKNRIIECTYKLIMTKGINNTSLANIQEEAEVGAGTIYHYFENKDELILTVIKRYIFKLYDDLIKDLFEYEANTYDSLKYMADTLSKFYYNLNDKNEPDNKGNYNKFKIFFIEGAEKYEAVEEKLKQLNNNFKELISRILKRGIENKEVKPNLSINEITDLIISLISGVYIVWMSNKSIDINKLLRNNIKNVWNCIKLEE